VSVVVCNKSLIYQALDHEILNQWSLTTMRETNTLVVGVSTLIHNSCTKVWDAASIENPSLCLYIYSRSYCNYGTTSTTVYINPFPEKI
jgi:hypothetical protein